MTIGEIVVIVVFALIWGWIVYEMHIAPEINDDNIKIDITEEDINDDLNCQYEGEDKEVL